MPSMKPKSYQRARLGTYALGDGRTVVVDFGAEGGGVRVSETFDAEGENPIELQRQGWQAILDRFARHVEAGR